MYEATLIARNVPTLLIGLRNFKEKRPGKGYVNASSGANNLIVVLTKKDYETGISSE